MTQMKNTTDDSADEAALKESAIARMTGVTLDQLGMIRDDYDEETTPEEIEQSRRSAQLLAGALGIAYDLLVDQLYEDLRTLYEEDRSAAGSMVCVPDELPDAYEDRYDSGFLQQFLPVVFDLGQRLASGFNRPSCVAQELAVELLFNRVGSVRDAFKLDLDKDWREIAEEGLLEDDDYKVLYEKAPYRPDSHPDFLGMVDMSFEKWFAPFPEMTVNPYTAATED